MAELNRRLSDPVPNPESPTVRAKTKVVPTVCIGGLPTAVTDRRDLAHRMVDDCLTARTSGSRRLPRMVFSSNGQGLALVGRSTDFSNAMNSADLIHADGMPIVLASKFSRRPLPERIATTDFFHDAAAAAVENGLRFYFLGGTEDQNARAVGAVASRYPGLQISGRHHGYFDESEADEICAEVCATGTDVLWIALGKPRQEYWSLKHREQLCGVGWVKTCGGLYAFLAGDVSRAPRWMQSCGLEWAFRMAEDPKRLLRRYATTNPYAAYRILRYSDWSFKAGRRRVLARKGVV